MASVAFSASLPAQTGNAGKFVTTDGTNASWALALASQTGNAGKFATTNGTISTWSLPPDSFRNRIINGDMRIDQRNVGAAVTPATSTYLVDRFTSSFTQASKLTFQQVADAPAGFKYSLKVTVAAQFAPAATDAFQIFQPIEGQNIIDFQLGTATAQSIAVSFWIKGSVAGTYSVSLRNGSLNRSYVGTVAVTNTWAQQTVLLTGDVAGTWATDNTVGMYLAVDLGSGTNVNTTAGTWQAGSFVRTVGSVTFVNQLAGATLNITGVQVESGAVATAFEQRPAGVELGLCQRFFQVIALGNGFIAPFTGFMQSATAGYFQVSYKVSMRTAVTFVASTQTNWFVNTGAGSTATTALVLSNGTTEGCFLIGTVAGQTIGYGASLSATVTTQTLTFSAEL